MADEATKQLLTDLKSYLTTGEFSDLIVTCGYKTFKVHKFFVCSRSGFFAKAIKFPAGKEAAEGKIDLPEDEHAIIELLFEYIYQAEYEPRLTSADTQSAPPTNGISPQTKPHSCHLNPSGNHCIRRYSSDDFQVCSHHYCGNNCNYDCVNFKCRECLPLPQINGTADQLLTHAKMYEIGDKYDVSGLKELSMHKFQLACAVYWDDPKFPAAANHAFCTTPEHDKGLRSIVCKTISENMVLMKKPEIEALMMEFNGLAFGILKEKAEENGWLK